MVSDRCGLQLSLPPFERTMRSMLVSSAPVGAGQFTVLEHTDEPGDIDDVGERLQANTKLPTIRKASLRFKVLRSQDRWR